MQLRRAERSVRPSMKRLAVVRVRLHGFVPRLRACVAGHAAAL